MCIRLENSGDVVASDNSDGDDTGAIREAFILPTKFLSRDFVCGNKANVNGSMDQPPHRLFEVFVFCS